MDIQKRKPQVMELLISNSLGNGSTAVTQVSIFSGGNYGDWYLPSYNELNMMYGSGVSGITNGIYWTSNELIVSDGILADKAYIFNFATGGGNAIDKLTLQRVRAVRKF